MGLLMLLLSRSLRRKLLATALSAVVFSLLYQATVIDSRAVGEADTAATGAAEPRLARWRSQPRPTAGAR